jgi:hypothetical protein
MNISDLRKRYREAFHTEPPKAFGPDLLRRSIAYRIQETAYGGLPPTAKRMLDRLVKNYWKNPTGRLETPRRIKPGSVLIREWKGKVHQVKVAAGGFSYGGRNYGSLSEIANTITGTKWNGPRFFGLRALTVQTQTRLVHGKGPSTAGTMRMAPSSRILRCAIYTRKSTEHGLELEFNSLTARREACEAYIKSQASQGWRALPRHYDDAAYSGGNLDRPALKHILQDIDAGKIDVVVVYKIDRLTRSLADFAKLVEILIVSQFHSSRLPSSSTPPPQWDG